MRKNIPLSKLFSKVEPWPFEKEININLVYSSCLKHANEMLLGDPRQSDQRTQSFHFPIVVHQSLDPAAQPSAQAPSSLSSSLHALRSSSARQAQSQNASTRWVYAPSRGNHMHDHSRFQRDINDVTGVSLSLYLSQKSLTHNIGSASALPIIMASLATSPPPPPSFLTASHEVTCARHWHSCSCTVLSLITICHTSKSIYSLVQ